MCDLGFGKMSHLLESAALEPLTFPLHQSCNQLHWLEGDHVVGGARQGLLYTAPG